MTELLIFLAVMALLFAALEFTHRRTQRRWSPGRDTRPDRDLARLNDDLTATAQREPEVSVRPDLRLTPGHEVADAWRYSHLAA